MSCTNLDLIVECWTEAHHLRERADLREPHNAARARAAADVLTGLADLLSRAGGG